jgi:hypothetical protein
LRRSKTFSNFVDPQQCVLAILFLTLAKLQFAQSIFNAISGQNDLNIFSPKDHYHYHFVELFKIRPK